MQLKKQCKTAVATSEENYLSAGGKGACFIKSSYLFHLHYKRDSFVCTHACSCASAFESGTRTKTIASSHVSI